VLTVRPEKTKNTTAVTLVIPVHPELQAIIEATPLGHLTLLTTRNGKSYSLNGFTDQFRDWCDAAGLPQHCVFHGLRKAAARRLAEAGCTPHQIAAITGHASLKEIVRYTKAVDQARLAREAIERIGTKSVKPEPPRVSKPLKIKAKT
jgi:integrase